VIIDVIRQAKPAPLATGDEAIDGSVVRHFDDYDGIVGEQLPYVAQDQERMELVLKVAEHDRRREVFRWKRRKSLRCRRPDAFAAERSKCRVGDGGKTFGNFDSKGNVTGWGWIENLTGAATEIKHRPRACQAGDDGLGLTANSELEARTRQTV